MADGLVFGTAGNPDGFYKSGLKRSEQMPAWLKEKGLGTYEYQCGHGIRIKEKTARTIGRQAQEQGISLSLHAPYYINLAATFSQLEKTFAYFRQSLQVAAWLGAERIVFHMGSPAGREREHAWADVRRNFEQVLCLRKELGLEHIELRPETMGKKNQLGSRVEEVFSLCRMGARVWPTFDFGHLHAVTAGGFTEEEDYEALLEKMVDALGEKSLQYFHIHFSQMEYTEKGEKRHGTFADGLGPPYQPFLQVLTQRSCSGRVVSESRGTQAEDALAMQKYYQTLLK